MNDLLPNPAQTTVLAQVALGFLLLALLLFGGRVTAETDANVSVEHIEPLSAEEVAELVAPIALYPDDLLSIVLPASTYPLHIVQAVRFLEARKEDENLEPPEAWDDSIIALLNYPEALELMNSDLDWTWKLGEAVLNQQEDVIDAIGDFRETARLVGNLESDEYQIVDELDDGTIEITLANPEVIYVPYYEPSSVTAYSPWPVYHYYPRAYPVYYYPYPAGYAFPSGRFWGVTSAFSIGWSTHRLHLHHYRYYDHPYHGHRYHDYHYYRRPHVTVSGDYYSSIDRNHRPIYRHHAGNYWYPHRYRQGASPRHRHHRHPGHHDGDRPGFDRHDRQREYRAGSQSGSFEGAGDGRQREQLVADRETRGGQLEGMAAGGRDPEHDAGGVPVGNARLITRGTRHRNGSPGARMTRKGTRADRPGRDKQRVERIDRQLSDAQNQGRTRHAAVQQRRAQHPQGQPRRAVRTAVVQQPREQQPAQHQARMSLTRPQPRSVAAVPERSRHSENRSSRATNKKGVTTRAIRALRSGRTAGFRRNQ